ARPLFAARRVADRHRAARAARHRRGIAYRRRMSSASSLRFTTFAAPSRFYALAGALLPWLWIATVALAVAGLWIGFFVAPTDATQGDAYRIIFIHVPAAWMSMLLYMVMALL